jgi:two-component system LytT family response regulator
MNILVVEDNEITRNALVHVLKSIDGVTQVYHTSNGDEAISMMENYHIDLFYLDINLPDISGIKVAEKIRTIPKYEFSYIIFITTYVYYQLDCFKQFHCYDFLEKPYSKEQIITLTKRIIRGVISNQKDDMKKVVFKLKDCILSLNVMDIYYIESFGRDCIIHTKQGMKKISNTPLKKLDKILPKEFIQSYRSYIININNIDRIEKKSKNAWTAYFRGYKQIALISDSYKKKVIEKIDSELEIIV